MKVENANTKSIVAYIFFREVSAMDERWQRSINVLSHVDKNFLGRC